MTACVWLTCPRDYALLVHSVASARLAFPGCQTIALVDIRETTEPQCADIVARTRFRRGGNLHSDEAPCGVAGALLAACDSVGADAVIKIDSDTLILSPDWAAPVLAGQSDVAGWRMAGRAGMGAAYAISARLLREVVASFAFAPAMSLAEDCEIVGRACLIAGLRGWNAAITTLADDPSTNTLRQYRGPESANGAHLQAIHCGLTRDTESVMCGILASRK